MSRRRPSTTALTAIALGLAAAAAAPAGAVITAERNALKIARAIADRPATVTGASFETIPTKGKPAALATTRLGGFPTSSDRYAILSTGNATIASNRNTGPASGVDLSGDIIRGARDVTTLKINLNVPKNASCLSVRFRFYSEEFPEYVGDEYNDAFIAELDRNTWDAGSETNPVITAPDNFAFDISRRPINVNSTGSINVSPARSSDTTYDAATRRLRASTPITPGKHSLYLTIFDQGDRIFDSAVFIDRLSLSNLKPCTSGAAVDSTGNPKGVIKLKTGRFSIPASKLFSPFRMRVTAPAYRPNPIRSSTRRAGLRIRVRDARGFVVRGATVRARSFPDGRLLPIETRTSRTDGTATLLLRPTPEFRQTAGQRAYVLIETTKKGGVPGRGVSGYRVVRINSAG